MNIEHTYIDPADEVCYFMIYVMQSYDYVFDIELDEGSPSMRKLKLPYNKTSETLQISYIE